MISQTIWSSFIDGYPFGKNALLNVWISETGWRQKVNLARKAVFETVQKTEETLRRVVGWILEFDEQIEVAFRRVIAASNRPEYIQPLDSEIPAIWRNSTFYNLNVHGFYIASIQILCQALNRIIASSVCSWAQRIGDCTANEVRNEWGSGGASALDPRSGERGYGTAFVRAAGEPLLWCLQHGGLPGGLRPTCFAPMRRQECLLHIGLCPPVGRSRCSCEQRLDGFSGRIDVAGSTV